MVVENARSRFAAVLLFGGDRGAGNGDVALNFHVSPNSAVLLRTWIADSVQHSLDGTKSAIDIQTYRLLS